MIYLESHTIERQCHAWQPCVLLDCLKIWNESGYCLATVCDDTSISGYGVWIDRKDNIYIVEYYGDPAHISKTEIFETLTEGRALEKFFLYLDRAVSSWEHDQEQSKKGT